MKTPLKMGLLAFFALCASALSAQNWAPAFEDDEVVISVGEIECERQMYLVFKIENKTNADMMPNFQVTYQNGGTNIDEKKGGFYVSAGSTVETDCSIIANFIESMYVPLKTTNVVSKDKVVINLL